MNFTSKKHIKPNNNKTKRIKRKPNVNISSYDNNYIGGNPDISYDEEIIKLYEKLSYKLRWANNNPMSYNPIRIFGDKLREKTNTDIITVIKDKKEYNINIDNLEDNIWELIERLKKIYDNQSQPSFYSKINPFRKFGLRDSKPNPKSARFLAKWSGRDPSGSGRGLSSVSFVKSDAAGKASAAGVPLAI